MPDIKLDPGEHLRPDDIPGPDTDTAPEAPDRTDDRPGPDITGLGALRPDVPASDPLDGDQH